MISDENYKVLLSFRNGLVPNDRKLTEREELLRQSGFIRLVQRRETKQGDGYSMTYEQGYWVLSGPGKLALEEYECHMREKCTEKEAEKKKEKAQRTANRFDTFAIGLLVAVTAGLFIYYWPSIIVFLTNFFQK